MDRSRTKKVLISSLYLTENEILQRTIAVIHTEMCEQPIYHQPSVTIFVQI